MRMQLIFTVVVVVAVVVVIVAVVVKVVVVVVMESISLERVDLWLGESSVKRG